MQPEWIIGIAGVLVAIFVSIAQRHKQSRPMLSAERYTSQISSQKIESTALFKV
jgi:hypothetical protein